MSARCRVLSPHQEPERLDWQEEADDRWHGLADEWNDAVKSSMLQSL
ncbi:hypothetical protein [Mycolicibacterium sphagni]|nr:hypothetical protein [Mycolicibacterium sphagni]